MLVMDVSERETGWREVIETARDLYGGMYEVEVGGRGGEREVARGRAPVVASISAD